MPKKSVKKSWFQGSTEVPSEDPKGLVSNDPNAVGYPNEMSYNRLEVPVGGDSRNWEQNWFEGAARDSKKYHGPAGEEFALKQKMQRIPMDEKIANAKLSTQFTVKKAAKDSYISVFATDNKTGKKEEVLRATLESLWGKNLDQKLAYQTRDKAYGKEVIARIRKEGFAKVAYLLTGDDSLVKQATARAEIKKAQALPMAEEATELDDVTNEVNMAAEEDATTADNTAEVLAEKKAELEEAESKLIELLPESAAEVGREVQEVEKELDEAIEEHTTIAAKLRDKTLSASAKVKIIRVAQEAFNETTEDVLPGADEVLDTVNDYLEKADAVIEKVETLVDEAGGVSDEPADELQADDGVELAGDMDDADDFAGDVDGEEDFEVAASDIKKFLNKRAEMKKEALGPEETKYQVTPDGAPADGKEEINRAHPTGGHDVTNLTAGAPVKDEGGKFETVTEAQDKDLDVANKMPTGELNSSAAARGKFKTASKVVEASADPATSAFWKEVYKDGDEAAHKFASELVGDYASKTTAAAIAEERIKIKRAHALAETAASKGLCDVTAKAKSDLADKIADFDDKAFVAYKEAVENARTIVASNDSLVRTASAKIPAVGQGDNLSKGGDFSRLSGLDWS